jgi:mono/diheme cytochrome c family protein
MTKRNLTRKQKRKVQKPNWPLIFIVAAGVALIGAGVFILRPASTQPDSTPSSLFEQPNIPPLPTLDVQQVARGEALYAQYCASCHGPNGEGDPNWQIRNADGSFKPPPHDSTGHTWHHADDLLVDLIATGSDFPQTQMPIFGDKLGDEEILAIIEYLKSGWGAEERAFQWQVTWQARQQNN